MDERGILVMMLGEEEGANIGRTYLAALLLDNVGTLS